VSARAAKWNISITNATFANKKVALNANLGGTAIYTTAPPNRTFTVRNDSDVMADIAVKVTYVDEAYTDSSAATPIVPTYDDAKETFVSIVIGTTTGGVTATPAGFVDSTAHLNYRFPPGATANFTITVNPSGMSTMQSHKCRLYIKGTQVD